MSFLWPSWSISRLFCFFVAVTIMLACAYAGTRMPGKQALQDKEVRDDFGIVQSASLTLLALVIGFSLSMAVGRYDQRKNYEEEEANAIGTEYLRADLLPAPQNKQMQSALKHYLALRLEFYAPLDADRRAQLNAEAGAAQKRHLASGARRRRSRNAQPSDGTGGGGR